MNGNDDRGGGATDRDRASDGAAAGDHAADGAAADGGSPDAEGARGDGTERGSGAGGANAAEHGDGADAADDAPSGSAPAEFPVSVDVEIDAGRSVIEVTGDRDAAVVVRSAGGERIYLPPEDFERPPASRGRGGAGGDARGTGGRQDSYGTGPTPSDSPYQSSSDSPYQTPFRRDSPYQSPDESDSPYQRGGPVEDRQGLEPTADGFRILHPEPVTDLRLLR